MEETNTRAYYNIATITTEKSFIVKAPGANILKLFTDVSYDFS
jgi:hypothetical protein